MSPTAFRCDGLGEISNPSEPLGHIYFTLKENDSVIKAVMFRRDAASAGRRVFEGAKRLFTVGLSLHKGRVSSDYLRLGYSLGVGSWFAAFERLKRKLWDAGLLRAETKKPIPKYPRRIGIVTSQPAELRDMMNVFSRRSPAPSFIFIPPRFRG